MDVVPTKEVKNEDQKGDKQARIYEGFADGARREARGPGHRSCPTGHYRVLGQHGSQLASSPGTNAQEEPATV